MTILSYCLVICWTSDLFSMFCCLPPIFTLLIALWSDHYWSDIVSASSWCDRFFSLLALYLLMLLMSISLIVYSVSRENSMMRETQLPIVIVFVFILILMSLFCTWPLQNIESRIQEIFYHIRLQANNLYLIYNQLKYIKIWNYWESNSQPDFLIGVNSQSKTRMLTIYWLC